MQILTRTGHLSEDVLELHAMKDLPESTQPLVEAHLALCRHCRSRLHQAEQFIRLFRVAARYGLLEKAA